MTTSELSAEASRPVALLLELPMDSSDALELATPRSRAFMLVLPKGGTQVAFTPRGCEGSEAYPQNAKLT
jgi:hypothetical protein